MTADECPCPLPECDRRVWCRPPAPTCPHPGNRSKHSPALHARFGGGADTSCGLPGCDRASVASSALGAGAGKIVTSREAAELLGVPAKRTAAWVERDKVRPVGLLPGRSRGGRGVPTFYLDDFRPLAEAYHARRRAREARA